MEASILCGGVGTRLRPLTYAVPKPLLPLGPKPILEVVITRMRDQGFKTFYLMVNYKADMIEDYFGTGENFGVNIEYSEEMTKRGTAGPLSALKGRITCPLVVLNSDLLTSLDFTKLREYHESRISDMTVALKKLDKKLAYGVVEVDSDSRITSMREKPNLCFHINSGIYVLSPKTLSLIPDEGEFQMTELIDIALSRGLKVIGYGFEESWIDIGRLDNYMKAISDLESERDSDTDRVFM